MCIAIVVFDIIALLDGHHICWLDVILLLVIGLIAVLHLLVADFLVRLGS